MVMILVKLAGASRISMFFSAIIWPVLWSTSRKPPAETFGGGGITTAAVAKKQEAARSNVETIFKRIYSAILLRFYHRASTFESISPKYTASRGAFLMGMQSRDLLNMDFISIHL